MEILEIKNKELQLQASDFNFERSRFTMGNLAHCDFLNVNLAGSTLTDVNLSQIQILDANLTDLVIENAQIGGARIHNVGMPPPGHPLYQEGSLMKPVRFEHCDLPRSVFKQCDLTGVEITDCMVAGMKINGVSVAEMMGAWEKMRG